MSDAVSELRYATRSLSKSPGFSIVFILTVGLGIGANTAVFSLVRGVLVRPLPHRGGDAVVHVRQTAVVSAIPDATFSVPEVVDYRRAVETLEGMAEFSALTFTMLGHDEPRRVRAGIVSGNYFDVMGLAAVRGRLLRAGDDGRRADPVMVLTYELWQRVFGGDPGVVGTTARMNGMPVSVVGVLEPVPQYPERTDVFVNVVTSPHHLSAAMTDDRQHRMTQVFARLAPGQSIRSATAELDGIAGRLALEYPEAYVDVDGPRVSVTSLKDELTMQARPTLFILLATASLVFLMACANVANLTLSRVLRRRRELSVRGALGAGRVRLRRILLVENLLLSIAGALVGLGVTLLAWRPLVAFVARFTPRAAEIELDVTILAFATAMAVSAAMLSALAPRLPAPGSGGCGRATGGREQRTLQRSLAVVQLAISFVLLIGAALLARTLVNLQHVDPGFSVGKILTMEIPLSRGGRSPAEIRGFYEGVERKVREVPGVTSAAMTSSIPLGGSPILFEVGVEGFVLESGASVPRADYRAVSPKYFDVMGIPLLKGRGFRDTDDTAGTPVVILNESMARDYFPDRDPIGRRIRWSDEQIRFVGIEGEWRTIVGVVSDTKDFALDQVAPHTVYQPFAQEPWPGGLVISSAVDPGALIPPVVDVVRRMAPDQPVENIRTLRQIRSERVGPERVNAILMGAFAALAAGIAAVGVFAVLAFSVSRRRKELGIRASFGADAGTLRRLVLREGMALQLRGLAVGGLAALALGGVLRGFLFGVEPNDRLLLVGVAVFLSAVALAASWVPAFRASRVDPVEALRLE